MKYRPSIAFNEFSGTARNVTASRNSAGPYIHAKSRGGHSAPTQSQQEVKALFASLQKSWKDLTRQQMTQWENAALTQEGRRILGQSAQITGINLYLRLNFWVVKCGGTALLQPPMLSGVESPADATAIVSQNRIALQLQQAPTTDGLKLVILVSEPQTIGTIKGVGRGASCTAPLNPVVTAINIRSAYIEKYGSPDENRPRVFFRYFLVNPATGERSLEKLTSALYAEEVIQYTVSLQPNDPDYGSVTPSVPTQYPQGTSVPIRATPAHGYAFTRWSDGVSQNPRTLHLNADVTLTAIFDADNHRTIRTEASPTGCGSVEGGGSYLIGQQVTLEAIPEDNCYFDHWEDDEWAPPTRQITVESDASYHAIFKRSYMDYKVNIFVDKPILGTTDPEPDEYRVSAGEDMTVYVIPDDDNGGIFLGWSDGNTDNPRTIAPTHNTRIQALFTSEYQVSISIEAEGSGTVEGSGIYTLGDTVTIRAIPNPGLTFLGWSDGKIQPVRTFVATEDLTLTASFGL